MGNGASKAQNEEQEELSSLPRNHHRPTTAVTPLVFSKHEDQGDDAGPTATPAKRYAERRADRDLSQSQTYKSATQKSLEFQTKLAEANAFTRPVGWIPRREAPLKTAATNECLDLLMDFRFCYDEFALELKDFAGSGWFRKLWTQHTECPRRQYEHGLCLEQFEEILKAVGYGLPSNSAKLNMRLLAEARRIRRGAKEVEEAWKRSQETATLEDGS